MTSARPATFRQATLRDIPAMSAIRLAVRENVLSNPDRITRQMYEDYLDVLGRGWVAEIDGEVAGFSYADKTNASIWALFISPDHEGKGLAKQLLNLATGWLVEQGSDRIRLSTGAGTRADRFYALQGWTRERVEANEAFYLLAASPNT
ncbi:GNAT family N-acetyltransferase [Duganella sp. BuS-21]|uniref:GNAT family N-acetyltransferase n=1 Tax=Duganella sp. BuS-21 TaxID=2943848 RepID=UPI0035A61C7D